jgi:hypothetical protein
MVQSWTSAQIGEVLTAAEVQARAVMANGVEEIAAQV